MKIKLLIVALLMIVISAELIGNVCKCPEITDKDECSERKYKICGLKDNLCVDYELTYTTVDTQCKTKSSKKLCHAIDGCAWTEADVCDSFTKCSDYKYQQGNDGAWYCVTADSSCTVGSVEDSYAICSDEPLDCTSIKNQTICNQDLYLDTFKKCIWDTNSNSCQLLDYTKCTTIKFEKYCTNDDNNCIWENSECKAPYCSYYKTNTTCQNYRNNEQNTTTLCQWGNNTCIDLDISTLNAQTCLANTNRSYHWTGSACVGCIGNSSSMLIIFGTLIFIMI